MYNKRNNAIVALGSVVESYDSKLKENQDKFG
jgi:hypothetical protein